jgi:hypothetical protein
MQARAKRERDSAKHQTKRAARNQRNPADSQAIENSGRVPLFLWPAGSVKRQKIESRGKLKMSPKFQKFRGKFKSSAEVPEQLGKIENFSRKFKSSAERSAFRRKFESSADNRKVPRKN